MLDELLGRSELKTEIEGLERELEDCEAQLAAEQERRREAVRDRQDAETRINQLEDRIAGLEGELEELRGGEREIRFQSVRNLSVEQTRRVIERLSTVTTEAERCLTAGVRDDVPSDAADLLDDRAGLLARAAPCVFCADDARVIRAILTPPRMPEPFLSWDSGFSLDREWFLPTGRFTFALVRADLFAMGEYQGTEQRDSSGFSSDVMGRHSKGGFSQARFERRREEQIAEHRDRVESTLGARGADPLILVGDRRVIGDLDLEPTVTGAVDASGNPEAALSEAFDSFWRTRLYIP